ncbi:MAG: hypothetical protein ACKVP7_07650 [Hyphomicrobiaceae bacterium]
MSETPIRPQRRGMIKDMMVRSFVETTQSAYIRQVKNFTFFLGRAPDTATPEELRAWQLTSAGVSRKRAIPTARSADIAAALAERQQAILALSRKRDVYRRSAPTCIPRRLTSLLIESACNPEIGHAIDLDHPGQSGSVMGLRCDESVPGLQPSHVAAVQMLWGPARQSTAATR